MNIHLPELKATNIMAIKSNTNCESTKPLPTELKINMCGTVGDEGHMIHNGTPNTNS